ncbi:hypothetical protein [Synechococcus sp. C9]|nr:hypothetical protein [Synechococcus sp. C9]
MTKNRSLPPRFRRSLWWGILALAWVLAGVASWRAISTSSLGR